VLHGPKEEHSFRGGGGGENRRDHRRDKWKRCIRGRISLQNHGRTGNLLQIIEGSGMRKLRECRCRLGTGVKKNVARGNGRGKDLRRKHRRRKQKRG